ncbi:hypothetical protein [Sphingopyxis sp.]|uniref:hypothetical protein n=1 Tax=Sphingopyxis sp. TaxID=1908224 RepID=UPI003F72A493
MTEPKIAAHLPVAPPIPLYPRDAGGRFGPGNPGRTPGSKNRVRRERLAAVQELFPRAIEVLTERLDAGDIGAAKMVLDACLPARGRTVDFDGDVSPEAIESALADGAITPTEAAQVASALKSVREVSDLEALTKRLEAIESALSST